jgi:hypothetical protein
MRGKKVTSETPAADEALALFNSRMQPGWHRETGWLVEIAIEGRPHWLELLHSGHEDWTADSLKATRFARKEDADTVISHRNIVDGIATEHAWEGPALPPSAEGKHGA